MDATEALTDTFRRVRAFVEGTIDGLEPDALIWRSDSEANTIAWLVWHLTWIQDDHVAGVTGRDQVWTASGWAERFGLKPSATDLG